MHSVRMSPAKNCIGFMCVASQCVVGARVESVWRENAMDLTLALNLPSIRAKKPAVNAHTRMPTPTAATKAKEIWPHKELRRIRKRGVPEMFSSLTFCSEGIA